MAVSLQGQTPHRTLIRAVLFGLVRVRGILCLTGPSESLVSPISPKSPSVICSFGRDSRMTLPLHPREKGRVSLMSPLTPGNGEGYRQVTVTPGNYSSVEVGVKVQFSSTHIFPSLKAALCSQLSMETSLELGVQASTKVGLLDSLCQPGAPRRD